MAKFQSNYEGLSHHWVHNTDHSECRDNRMFSENDKIYSYGYHFLIAQKVKDKHGGLIYLINLDSYSKTTSRQMRALEQAIPSYYKSFKLPEASLNHKNNIDYFVSEIHCYCDKESRAKTIDYMPDIKHALTTLKDYINNFKVDKRKFTKHIKYLLSFNPEESSKEDITNLLITVSGIKNDKIRTARKAKRKAEKKTLNNYKISSKEWLEGTRRYITIPTCITEILLRYNAKQNIIETSNSAHITLQEAEDFHAKVKRGKKLLGTKVGDFKIIKASEEYTIGCTTLTKEILNDMCKQLNWEEVF